MNANALVVIEFFKYGDIMKFVIFSFYVRDSVFLNYNFIKYLFLLFDLKI